MTEEESLTSNNPVGIPESEGRLSPDTYELIDQYINKMDPGADREEIAKDIINGYTHTSELEYALQPDIDEGILDTLKKVGGKVLDTLGHEDDVLKDLQKKAGIPAHAQHGKPNMAQSNEKEVDESALQAYLGDKKYGKDGMEALRKAGQDHAGEKKMQNIRAKYSSKEDEVSEEVDMGQADSSLRNEPKQNNDKMDHFTALGKASKKLGHDHYMDVPDDKLEALRAMVKRFRAGEEVDEGETHTTRGGTVSHKDGVTKHQAGPGVYGGYDDTTHPDSPEEKHLNSPGAKTGHNTDQIKKFKFTEGEGNFAKAIENLHGWYQHDSSDPDVEVFDFDDGEGGYYAQGTIEHNLKTGEINVEFEDTSGEYGGGSIKEKFNSIGDAMNVLRGITSQMRYNSGRKPNFDTLGGTKLAGPDDLYKTDKAGKKGTLTKARMDRMKMSSPYSMRGGPKGVLPEGQEDLDTIRRLLGK